VTHIHEPNEVMDLASLEKATLIYYKAIEKLME
jgi:acetylornithine deacetylase/succinyl-diaminopimelate desuccinylase-like protein